MIDFSKIEPAAKAWASQYSGLPAVMEDEARPWTGKAFVSLEILASQSLGEDEARYELDEDLPANANMVPTFCGNRIFTLSVKVESREQSPVGHAVHHLEKLRSSLARPLVKAAFYAAGFSVAQSLGTVSQKRVVDGRVETVAVMDLRCNAASVVVDQGPEIVGPVDHVKVTSTLTPSAGVDLDDEEFP